MQYISSVHNDQVKHLLELQNASYRYERGQFAAEGTRACRQLMEKYHPVNIYMTESYYNSNDFPGYENIIIGLADHVMDKISTSKTPSGIFAVFNIPQKQPLPTTGPGLVTVNMSDPGNLGTLLRTAAAMNVTQIILIGGVDPYNAKVVQATAGCLADLTIHQTNFETLAQHKIPLCGLVVQGGKRAEQLDLQSMFLVVGNEAHGLSAEQIASCHETMTIPMPGKTESLNAAIAGAIGLYLMTQN